MGQTVEERIAELELKVAGQAKEAADHEQALMAPPSNRGGYQGVTKILQRQQDEARRERQRLHAEFNEAYEAQLEANRPEIERLQAELQALAEQRAELECKHAAAAANLDTHAGELVGQINELSAAPPMPILSREG